MKLGCFLKKEIFFIFFIVGCGYNSLNKPANVAISSNIDYRLRKIIEDSFIEINERAKKDIVFFEDSKKSDIIVDIDSSLPKRKLLGTATLMSGICKIDIADNIIFFEDLIRFVLWHELGHCFGLEHDLVRGEIMYNGPQRFSSITEEAKTRFINRIM